MSHDAEGMAQPPRLGVIADDLSGAMDTGLQFANHGLSTWVALTVWDYAALPVLVVSSESRDETDDQIVRRVKEAAWQMQGRTVYKKLDSTLRGNPGLEITTLLRELGYVKAIITPAFPEQGRIVRDGQLWVHDRPLHRSELARSLRWPLVSAHIADVLRRGTTALCAQVELQKVERGPWGLVRALDSVCGDLVVVDAVTREHLDVIAEAMLLAEERWLPCGSAGLARSWAARFGVAGATHPPPPATAAPALIVAGSRQRTTAQQIHHVERTRHVRVLRISISGSLDADRKTISEAMRLLGEGQSIVLTIASGPFVRGSEQEVAARLGRATAALCAAVPLAGLILTGGDVAVAVCRALGTDAIELRQEIEPGVPVGVLHGGSGDGLYVITKAGGFGSMEVLGRAMDYVRGGAA